MALEALRSRAFSGRPPPRSPPNGEESPFSSQLPQGSVDGGSQYPRGLLDRYQLERGASRLLGPWFDEATGDPGRLGWGVAFETVAERATYQPELRYGRAALGALSPPRAPLTEQTWHTY